LLDQYIQHLTTCRTSIYIYSTSKCWLVFENQVKSQHTCACKSAPHFYAHVYKQTNRVKSTPASIHTGNRNCQPVKPI